MVFSSEFGCHQSTLDVISKFGYSGLSIVEYTVRKKWEKVIIHPFVQAPICVVGEVDRLVLQYWRPLILERVTKVMMHKTYVIIQQEFPGNSIFIR